MPAYTAAALVAALAAVLADLVLLRTRLLLTRQWWLSYAVVVAFQLLTNGWLTGRRVVEYAPGAVLGDGRVELAGDGRLAYAPVEDLGFGFALVLLTCVVWTRLGGSGPRRAAGGTGGGAGSGTRGVTGRGGTGRGAGQRRRPDGAGGR